VPAAPLPAVSESRIFGGRAIGSPVVVTQQSVPSRAPDPAGEIRAAAVPPVIYNRTAEALAAQPEGAGIADPSAVKSSGALSSSRNIGSPGLAPGARVPGSLLTGATVVAGGPPVPVVVEAVDPHGIWTGQAVLGPGDRVQITLTLAAQNRSDAVKGVALDPQRLVVGLAGHTTVQHSSAAATATAAALQAASDYAQAVARQGSFSVLEGWGPVVVGGQVPDPWTYFAARLAQEFQPRSTAGGWVTTTEVPAGTPLLILVTGAS